MAEVSNGGQSTSDTTSRARTRPSASPSGQSCAGSAAVADSRILRGSSTEITAAIVNGRREGQRRETGDGRRKTGEGRRMRGGCNRPKFFLVYRLPSSVYRLTTVTIRLTQTMEKRFEYRGDLAATPLAEILATIDRYRVPGSLTLTWEERVRKIALEAGQVITAGSNESDTSLGMYLLR